MTRPSKAFHIPLRGLFPTQMRTLRDKVGKLMTDLQEREKNSSLKILGTHFVNCARSLWQESEGGRVRSIQDIKEYFKKLEGKIAEESLTEMYLKLLISWGTEGYTSLYDTSPKAARWLAKKYHIYLEEIIRVDIQADMQFFLPELEMGKKDGTIFSAILMRNLVKQGEETPYPAIAPFESDIKMGTAIKEAMLEKNLDVATENQNELNKQRKPSENVHRHYVTGIKRWIGKNKKDFFIDKHEECFYDTYDPLYKLGLRYLIEGTEKSFDREKKWCLNKLIITYPTSLSQSGRQSMRNTLKGLGAADIDMSFDEATAAALYYVWQELFADIFSGIDGFLARCRITTKNHISKWTNEKETLYVQNFLLYDMGGGTTDIALLEIAIAESSGSQKAEYIDGQGRYFVIYPKILGLTGKENFAGDNVTLAVFRILKTKLATQVALALSKYENQLHSEELIEVINEVQNKGSGLLTDWIKNTRNWQTKYEEVRHKINILVPTNFQEDLHRQSIFTRLWNEAELLKIQLSQEDTNGVAQMRRRELTEIVDEVFAYLNLEGIHSAEIAEIAITLKEMERLIRVEVAETFEQARNLCIGAGEDGKPCIDHQIDKVILAGSSSQLRIIREEMPYEVLAKPFSINVEEEKYQLPAPFKYEEQNVHFNHQEAKRAVVRGACLGHYYWKEHAFTPNHPEVTRHLREKRSFLYLDIDNLKSYLPFTIGYEVYAAGGGGKQLFEATDPFDANNVEDNGEKIARSKAISFLKTLRCYRYENTYQVKAVKKGLQYAQFELGSHVASHAGFSSEDEQKIQEEANRYLFYVELDGDRNLTCYMYTNPDGNSNMEYVKQELMPQDQEKAQAVLCQHDGKDSYTWNREIKLAYNTNADKPLPINFKQGNPPWETKTREEAVFYAQVDMLYSEPPKAGAFCFYSMDGEQAKELLWKLDLSHYEVKHFSGNKISAFAKLYLVLKLKQDIPVLEYTVYDPDLKDSIQIPEVPFDQEKIRLFNPFSGEE